MNNEEIRGWVVLVGGLIVAFSIAFITGTAAYRGMESSTKETIRIGPNTLRTVVHCQTGKTFIINDRSGTMLDLGVKTECSTRP